MGDGLSQRNVRRIPRDERAEKESCLTVDCDTIGMAERQRDLDLRRDLLSLSAQLARLADRLVVVKN